MGISDAILPNGKFATPVAGCRLVLPNAIKRRMCIYRQDRLCDAFARWQDLLHSCLDNVTNVGGIL